MNFQYHYAVSEKVKDPTIKAATELYFEIGNPENDEGPWVTRIDRSIVNGLRRVLLGEVKTRGFGKRILIPESYLDPNDVIQRGNVTIFNSEHLSDRIGMVPIHDYVDPLSGLNKDEKDLASNLLGTFKTDRNLAPSLLVDNQYWVFRICDPKDPNLPLKNLNDSTDMYNRQRFVKVKDIRVFRRSLAKPIEAEGIPAPLAPSAPVIIAHTKEKISQVSSKIQYIFLNLPGKEIWTEESEEFKAQIFKYPELILLSLKKGEGVFAEMIVETGYGGVIEPNVMLPPANSHARWISAIPDYRFKTKKEFDPSYDRDKQIANSLANFELDHKLAPLRSQLNIDRITLKKVKEYQNNIDKSEFFEGNELIKQKKNLEIRVLELENNIKKTEIMINDLEKTRSSADLAHDPVQDQKDYLISRDSILLRYGNPERYMINITYNGHLWPIDAWINAIITMIEKIRKFKHIVNQIQDQSGRVTERALVQFDHNISHKFSIIIDDKVDIESHTLGNLIKSHFIYMLDHIIGHLYPEAYVEVWLNCFSNYLQPHPLQPELVMTFKTPGDSFPLFPGQGRYKLGEEATGNIKNSPFAHLHNDETNETLRLLKITIDQLLIRLESLLNDSGKMKKELEK